jgi:hypothetical protein
VGPKVGLEGSEKSRPHRDSIPDRPARSQSLYRYPGPNLIRVGHRSVKMVEFELEGIKFKFRIRILWTEMCTMVGKSKHMPGIAQMMHSFVQRSQLVW